MSKANSAEDDGLGVDSSLSILVMLNLFQHPWPGLASGAAPKETADHGP
jgi:hypothetical protein